MKSRFKFIVVLTLGVIFFLIYKTGWLSYLNLDSLKQNQIWLQEQILLQPILARSFFFLLYIGVTALSLPGAAVLTLAGGYLFGFFEGTVLISFASTLGATLAFLLSRFLLRDWVEKRFGKRLMAINEGVQKEGVWYLFTLRLVPLFPFFLVNLLMGLTPIKTWSFYWVSQLGMLAGTIVYVNAGKELSKVNSLSEILSPSLIVAFVALGVLPLFARFSIDLLKSRRIYKKFSKPKKFDYNMVVIGGGSAGLVTSYIAAAIKAKVALVEKHKMGGDCLNTGCVPSKALIKSAKIAHQVSKASDYGIKVTVSETQFTDVMDRIQNVITKIAPHDSVERFTKLGVECLVGEAKIETPYQVRVGNNVITTKSIVVATGARPLVPKIPGLEDISYYTSDNIWELRELPKRLLVLGGGPIGCELAQAFQRLGSKVIQVEMAPRLMSREDEDVSSYIKEVFCKEGIQVLTSHKAESFSKGNSGFLLECAGPNGKTTIEFDHLLLALGRSPNTKGFGLEELGVEIEKRGTIAHDPYLRTKYPNILVCGDVAGPYQFTHTAAHQAWYAAVNGLVSPFKKFKADYSVIPWCTFTDPEVARVGLSEKEARDKEIEVEVTRYNLDDLDRAITESQDHGFVKVLTKKGSDEVLGATIVGAHAGDMITEFITAMKHKIGLNKILGTIHIYPTFPEANKYAAGLWKQAHKPEKLLKWVEKLHKWRRG